MKNDVQKNGFLGEVIAVTNQKGVLVKPLLQSILALLYVNWAIRFYA